MISGRSLALGLSLLTMVIAIPAQSQYEASIQPVATQASDRGKISQWFIRYDQIRREAQMNPVERQQADTLLSKGMSIVTPGPEKEAARQLLTKLVNRYQKAKGAMRSLPMLPETQKLHRGYYQYFSTAEELFGTYLTVQDNLFAKDPATGQPLIGQMMARKTKLESLNNFVQELDQQTRNQFNIAPYKYRG
jgi:hypothetical protein